MPNAEKRPEAGAMSVHDAVVVTGRGLVTPLGFDVHAVFDAWCRGECAAVRNDRFGAGDLACPAAAPVTCEPTPVWRVPKLAKFASAPVRWAIQSTRAALAEAALEPETWRADRIGIYGASGETTLDVEQFFPALTAAWGRDATADFRDLGGAPSRLVDPYFQLKTLANGAVALASIDLEAGGPSFAFVQGETAAAHALQAAADDIADGRIDHAIVVACDSLLSPTAWLAHARAGRLSTRQPPVAHRAFDVEAAGFVPGEGAAALVLEHAGTARARGARALVELAGLGLSAGAFDRWPAAAGHEPGVVVGPDFARAVALTVRAWGQAGQLRHGADRAGSAQPAPPSLVPPALVIARGIALPGADHVEAAALSSLPLSGAAVTCSKGALGYLGAAGPIVDVALAVSALERRVAPPAVGLDEVAWGDGLAFVRHGCVSLPGVARQGAIVCAASWCGQTAVIRLQAIAS